MKHDEMKKALEIVDSELKKAGISRRDAFKLAGLGEQRLKLQLLQKLVKQKEKY